MTSAMCTHCGRIGYGETLESLDITHAPGCPALDGAPIPTVTPHVVRPEADGPIDPAGLKPLRTMAEPDWSMWGTTFFAPEHPLATHYTPNGVQRPRFTFCGIALAPHITAERLPADCMVCGACCEVGSEIAKVARGPALPEGWEPR